MFGHELLVNYVLADRHREAQHAALVREAKAANQVLSLSESRRASDPTGEPLAFGQRGVAGARPA